MFGRPMCTKFWFPMGLALIGVTMPAQACVPTQLRVMTYNIRLDTAADGPNRWVHRRAWVSAQIEWFRPDIFGLQEVVFNQKQDIAADLFGYRLVGKGRDDGRDGGESSPVGYDARRFDLLDSGTFWLSPTPDRPSKGWDAAYPRVATWARLRVKRRKMTLLAINTHWDHVGIESRNQSALLIGKWLTDNRRKDDRVIMLGDFNIGIASDAMRTLTDVAGSYLHDSRMTSQTRPFGPEGTFNDFKLQPETSKTIDHILVGNNIAVTRYAVIAQNVDGRMLSDHYPVLADLALGSECK